MLIRWTINFYHIFSIDQHEIDEGAAFNQIITHRKCVIIFNNYLGFEFNTIHLNYVMILSFII